MTGWPEPRGCPPRDRAAVAPCPGRLRGSGLHSHPHQRLRLRFTQGDQPVATALGWSPAASLAGGAVSQLPLGEITELGPFLWTWGGSRGMLMGSCALAHPGAGGLGAGLASSMLLAVQEKQPRHAGRLDSIPGGPHVKNRRFSLKTKYAHSPQAQHQCLHSNSLALMV